MSGGMPFSAKKLELFVEELVDNHEAETAQLLWAILETRSPRKSDWAQVYGEGNEDSNYKRIERIWPYLEPELALRRLYDPQSQYVLVDATEIEREDAKRTSYVGRLSDGKTLGFWAMVFAQPYRGRVVPFYLGTYSESTIAQEVSSRNLEWQNMVYQVHALTGGGVWVFDREFSAQGWLETLNQAGVSYAIRLNTSNDVSLTNAKEKAVSLHVEAGQTRTYPKLYYRGEVEVNIAGFWDVRFKQPLWVMGNIDPDLLLLIYRERMKLEEGFKDLKSLLNLDKVMSKQRQNMEKTLRLVLLAYAVGLLIGEKARDQAYQKGARKLSKPNGTTIQGSSSCSKSV
jgi:hypothetical protein